MSLAATLDALEQAGASAEVILAVVRAHLAQEDARLTKRREQDAARQRSKRSRHVTRTHADSRTTDDGHADPEPRARVRDNNPRLVISGSDDDVDCASAGSSSDDWPKLKGRQTYGELLAETVASPWLDPKKTPGLIETGGRVVAWKRDGASWEHDVVPVVTALCVKAGKRITRWSYFDGTVAQTIADNRAALAIPEAAQVVPLRPGGGASLTDRIAAENAESRRLAFAMLDKKNV